MRLQELREFYNLTQSNVAKLAGISLRSYQRYENNNSYGNPLVRKSLINIINEHYGITEEKGILTIPQIKRITSEVFESYGDKISYCYLFGSYAKGGANGKSDVDLCVSSSLKGIAIAGLIESLREKLHKNVDYIRADTLPENPKLLEEIMKGGIKIFG